MARKEKDTITMVMSLTAAVAAAHALKSEVSCARKKEAENPGENFWRDARIDSEKQYTEFDRALDIGPLS